MDFHTKQRRERRRNEGVWTDCVLSLTAMLQVLQRIQVEGAECSNKSIGVSVAPHRKTVGCSRRA
jgi:hypothetical protein